MKLLDIFFILLLLASPAFVCAIGRARACVADIHTVRLIVDDNYELPAFIVLGSQQQATLSFDLLADAPEHLSYRVSHRNADGTRSAISDLESLDGFNDINLDDPTPSFSTFIPYYHYELTFPNERLTPRLSGNYLIEVYRDSDPTEVLVSATLGVVELLTDINASLRTATDFDFNAAHQQLDINLTWRSAPNGNAAHDVTLLVTQNGRTDNAVRLNAPTTVSSCGADYEHVRQLIFEAGNNFRRFDVASHRYPGVGVSKIIYISPTYHVLLTPGEKRADKPYYYDQHQYGRYVIRNSDATDSDTESEYIYVHFELRSALPLQGDVYIYGDLTDREFSTEAQMDYNAERGCYEKTLLLKQGHYNYQYLFRPFNTRRATTAPIEGNFCETANEYLIRAYYRPPGARYDRLIGTKAVR